jgi:hypothetical protein
LQNALNPPSIGWGSQGNCTAVSAKIGIINVDRVDGLIIDRLHLVGDPARA